MIRPWSRVDRVVFAMMKSVTLKSILLVAAVLMALSLAGLSPDRAQAGENPPWKLCFSPDGHCSSLILDALSTARESVRVQAYSFTARPIAEALVEARRRGVDVAVIVDKSQTSERYSVIDLLNEAGIPLYVDYCCAIAHNKVMVIDGKKVVTGSYNFTQGAENKNAENLLVIDDAVMAKAYLENWTVHRDGARVFAAK
jgi:phosphatidylserine/phosphatidylglycerophosphate/cardiolipin synthase-like enzyme